MSYHLSNSKFDTKNYKWLMLKIVLIFTDYSEIIYEGLVLVFTDYWEIIYEGE